jgi:hypothetical protein
MIGFFFNLRIRQDLQDYLDILKNPVHPVDPVRKKI